MNERSTAEACMLRRLDRRKPEKSCVMIKSSAQIYSRDERSTQQHACVAAGSIGRGRRQTGRTAPHAYTPNTQAMLMRTHTLAMFAILAVFQAPMFALNADANENACGPSHTLAKSPRRISPDGSVQCIVHAASSGPSACGAMCRRSSIEMRRNGGGWTRTKTAESHRTATSDHKILEK
jgi:hypothetical protein